MIGTAVVPVRQGHPADHWVVLRTRKGGAQRKNPAVHLRVAYGSSPSGGKADGKSAFLA